MKTQLFVIAAIAIVSTQAAYAAEFKIINQARQMYDFSLDSAGLNRNNANFTVDAGASSNTIKTGLNKVNSITWTAQGQSGAMPFKANITVPVVLLGGTFTVLDTEGNYEYDFNVHGKGKGRANKFK